MIDATEKLCAKHAEAAVLGSMVLDPQCVGDAIQLLPGEKDFFVDAHKVIYKAIRAVWADAPSFDGLMVRDWLAQQNLLEKIGGVEYLQRVVDSVPCAANCRYYARIVADRRRYRDAVKAVEEMERVLTDGDDVGEQVAQVQSIAMALEAAQPKTVFSTSQHATDVALAAQDMTDALPTGLANLDTLIDGVRPGELVIVAARPSMGKTALAGQICLNVAVEGGAVLFFTLEMTGPSLIERLIAQRSKVNPKCLQHGPDQRTLDAWHRASLDLEGMNITVVEGCDKVEKQTAFLRSHTHSSCVDLVIVDYLQLMTAQGQSRYEQVTNISRQLKLMALAEGVPVLALAQLNRANETRTDKRPLMADLRDSGSIEQDADVVILLHREDYYRRQRHEGDQKPRDGVAEAIVAKNRRGPVGVAKLVFIDECFGFGDMAKELKNLGDSNEN